MPYGTVNADVIQTSTGGGILGAGNASIMKNRIINGAMTVSQYNGTNTTTPANATYVIDRWRANSDQSGKYSTAQSSTAPTGFSNSLLITSLSAYTVGASEIFNILQRIEGFNTYDLGFGTANAKTITISFWVRSSLTGTFGGALQNNDQDRSYPFSYTISSANTWTQASVTIAGDTTGTWVGATNGNGMGLCFSLGSGSAMSATAGAWTTGDKRSATGAVSVVGTNGATFYITGVQLEVGSSATGFEYVNYQTSLANCQRYYQQINGNTSVGTAAYGMMGSGMVYTTTQADISIPLKVSMRATPTLAQSTTVIQVGGTLYATTSITDAGSTPNVVFARVGNAGTMVIGSGANLSSNNSTSGYFSMSAEL
jgi:hypothetical protein